MKTKTRSLGIFQAIKNYIYDECGEVNLGNDTGDATADTSAAPETISDLDSELDLELSDDSIQDDSQMSQSYDDSPEVNATNEQELEQEIQEAVENGASEDQVKSMIRKYNLKIDGEEIEEEVDLDNEEEMIRTLQLAKKSHKTMQEKAELEKATAAFLQEMRKNPFEALKQLDPEFNEMEYMAKVIEELEKQNAMSPEEKENARIRKEYEQMVAERDRLRKEAEERKRQEETQIILNQIKSDISRALEADDDLVVNDNNIALIAQEMAKASKNNVELSAQQALEIAKKRIQNEYNQYANMFKSTASMKKYMGPELLERLKEDRIKAAQQQSQVKNAKANPVSPVQNNQKIAKKRLSINDILAGRADSSELED